MDDQVPVPDPEHQLPAGRPPSSPGKANKRSTRDKPRSGRKRGRQRQRKGKRVPDLDELLWMFMQLNGMLMTGLISSATANAIHRNLRAMLDTKLKLASGGDQGAASQDLVEVCRKYPKILNTVESFLTDEQIDWIVSQIEEDEDEDG